MNCNIFNYKHDYFSLATKLQIQNCNEVISKYGYGIIYEILENDDVFLQVKKQTKHYDKKCRVVISDIKKTFAEITKE